MQRFEGIQHPETNPDPRFPSIHLVKKLLGCQVQSGKNVGNQSDHGSLRSCPARTIKAKEPRLVTSTPHVNHMKIKHYPKGNVHLEGGRQGWIDPGMRTPTMSKHYIDRLEYSALKLRNVDGDRGQAKQNGAVFAKSPHLNLQGFLYFCGGMASCPLPQAL